MHMLRRASVGAALPALVSALLFSGAALASDPYSALTSAVDFTSVKTDVISTAALVVAVLVAVRAVRFIYGIVRR